VVAAAWPGDSALCLSRRTTNVCLSLSFSDLDGAALVVFFFAIPPERQRRAKQIRRGLFLIPRIWMCLQVSSDAVHKLKPSRPEAAADSQNHDLRPLSHQLVRQWRGQGARVPQTPAETCGQVCFFLSWISFVLHKSHQVQIQSISCIKESTEWDKAI
jgi:hypothetical protein